MSTRAKRLILFLSGLLAVVSMTALMAFDPFNPSNPEPLPTSVTEAETRVNSLVYAHTGQYPDAVECTEVYEYGHYVYLCWVSKVGYETQLMGVEKGS